MAKDCSLSNNLNMGASKTEASSNHKNLYNIKALTQLALAKSKSAAQSTSGHESSNDETRALRASGVSLLGGIVDEMRKRDKKAAVKVVQYQGLQSNNNGFSLKRFDSDLSHQFKKYQENCGNFTSASAMTDTKARSILSVAALALMTHAKSATNVFSRMASSAGGVGQN